MRIAEIIVAQLLLSAFIIFLSAWSLHRLDLILSQGDAESAADEIDPYEIAFLTGGERAVIVVAVYKLLKDRLLRIVSTTTAANREMKAIVADQNSISATRSSAIDIAVLEYFREGRTLATALELHLPQTIHVFCQPYSLFLKAQRLLAPNEAYAFAAKMRLLGVAVLVSSAIYATFCIFQVRPDLTTSTLAIGVGAIAVLYRWGQVRRVTLRGEAFLTLLRREALAPSYKMTTADMSERAAVVVALFGWSGLHDPGDAEFRSMVQYSGAGLGTPSYNGAQLRDMGR